MFRNCIFKKPSQLSITLPSPEELVITSYSSNKTPVTSTALKNKQNLIKNEAINRNNLNLSKKNSYRIGASSIKPVSISMPNFSNARPERRRSTTGFINNEPKSSFPVKIRRNNSLATVPETVNYNNNNNFRYKSLSPNISKPVWTHSRPNTVQNEVRTRKLTEKISNTSIDARPPTRMPQNRRITEQNMNNNTVHSNRQENSESTPNLQTNQNNRNRVVISRQGQRSNLKVRSLGTLPGFSNEGSHQQSQNHNHYRSSHTKNTRKRYSTRPGSNTRLVPNPSEVIQDFRQDYNRKNNHNNNFYSINRQVNENRIKNQIIRFPSSSNENINFVPNVVGNKLMSQRGRLKPELIRDRKPSSQKEITKSDLTNVNHISNLVNEKLQEYSQKQRQNNNNNAANNTRESSIPRLSGLDDEKLKRLEKAVYKKLTEKLSSRGCTPRSTPRSKTRPKISAVPNEILNVTAKTPEVSVMNIYSSATKKEADNTNIYEKKSQKGKFCFF